MDQIQILIQEGRKSWIQTKTKDELIEIVNKLATGTSFSNLNTIDEIRVFLRNYVDKKIPSPTMTLNSSSYIACLEVYTGGNNWNAYEQQLECFILLNDIPEGKKVPLLITKLSTNVYDLLITLCIPKSPMEETYNTICEKLRKHYHPVKNAAIHQAEFRQRSQKQDETIDQYLLDLKKLSKNCNFKNLNEEIKERLLNGTYCDSVRFELLKQADQPLEVLTTIGKTVETAYNLTFNHEKQQERSQMFKLHGRSFPRSNNSGSRQSAGSSNKQNITCFCCGKNGHVKAECTLKEKFCSECGVKGHIFRVCNKNKQIKMKNLNVIKNASSDSEENTEENKDLLEDIEVFDIFYFGDKQKIPSATLEVNVNGKVLEFEVDTGADVSTITLSDKELYFPDLELKQKNVIFTNFDQSTSTPLGVIEHLSVSYRSVQVSNLRLFVVKNGLPKIIGKDWLSLLQLWPPKFEQKVFEIITAKDKLIKDLKTEYK